MTAFYRGRRSYGYFGISALLAQLGVQPDFASAVTGATEADS
ncbi:hypothetical protein ACWDWU_24465 [Streptomyces sp. NPDC003442]